MYMGREVKSNGVLISWRIVGMVQESRSASVSAIENFRIPKYGRHLTSFSSILSTGGNRMSRVSFYSLLAISTEHNSRMKSVRKLNALRNTASNTKPGQQILCDCNLARIGISPNATSRHIGSKTSVGVQGIHPLSLLEHSQGCP
jgi:hypothetical protein